MTAVLAMTGCEHAWDQYATEASSSDDAQTGSTSATGTAGGDVAASSSATSGSSGTGGGGGEGGAGGAGELVTVAYSALVAECVDSDVPDPAACAENAGFGQMQVDGPNPGTLTKFSFMRFDLDPSYVTKSVDRVALQLVVVGEADATSNQSGEVWEVTPFEAEDLTITLPSPVGSAPMAEDLGPVLQSQTVTWELPARIASGTSVFLGVIPVTGDRVKYWNRDGLVPPQLLVSYR